MASTTNGTSSSLVPPAMTLLTVIILGIVYLRFVMPDVVVVKTQAQQIHHIK